jgi:O-antigen/teichoic acid export membrane protein
MLAPFRGLPYNALVKLTSELGGRLALFVLILVAARQMSEASFGLYSYALALGFVLAQLTDLGLQLVTTRQIALESGSPDATDANGLVVVALRFKVVLSAAVVLCLWVFASRQPGDRAALFLLSLLPLWQSYAEFTGYVYRGRQNLRVEARLLAALRVTLALVGVASLWAFGSLFALALGQAAVGLGYAAAALLLLRRGGWVRRGRDVLAVHRLAGQRRQLAYLLRQALPLGLAIFLSVVYARLGVLMLQYTTGETAVAQFSAAARLSEPAQLIPASVMAAVFPAFTVALRGQGRRARQLGGRTTALLAAVGAGLALAGWLAAPVLLPLLYGATYQPSAAIFRVTGITLIPAFVNYSLTHYLIARGQQAVLGPFVALMLAAHAGLSWLLIPRIGATGPAVSMVAAELLLTTLCVLALRRPRPASRPRPKAVEPFTPDDRAEPGITT